MFVPVKIAFEALRTNPVLRSATGPFTPSRHHAIMSSSRPHTITAITSSCLHVFTPSRSHTFTAIVTFREPHPIPLQSHTREHFIPGIRHPWDASSQEWSFPPVPPPRMAFLHAFQHGILCIISKHLPALTCTSRGHSVSRSYSLAATGYKNNNSLPTKQLF